MNELISRSEEERLIFNEMDLERARVPSDHERLMQEHELPPSLLNEPTQVADPDDDPANLGRGRRPKDSVMYDDGLTEEQYLQALENEHDIPELIQKKRAQRQRREEKRLNQDSPETFNDSSDATPRKRARTARTPGEPRPRKSKTDDTLPPHIRTLLNKRMIKCVVAMEDLRDSYDPERRISFLFDRLPSRRDYPDYYEYIKNPISIKNIRQRIKDCEYQAARDLHADCMLMFDNARLYNEESSQVYSDAGLLQKAFTRAFEENFPPEEGHIRSQKSHVQSDSESELNPRDKTADQSSPASSSSWIQSSSRHNYRDDYD